MKKRKPAAPRRQVSQTLALLDFAGFLRPGPFYMECEVFASLRRQGFDDDRARRLVESAKETGALEYSHDIGLLPGFPCYTFNPAKSLVKI